MLSGIRKRLLGSYFLIILITVIFFEIAIIMGIRQYYLNSVSNNLKNKAELVSSFYNNFLDFGDIYSNSQQIINLFAERTFQLQITDKKGNVIADSLGKTEENILAYEEVKTALSGKKGEYKGIRKETGEKIYACSVPLTSNGMIVGALRFTTSLEQTYQVLNALTLRLLVFGLFLSVIVLAIAVLMLRTITTPLEGIAEKSN